MKKTELDIFIYQVGQFLSYNIDVDICGCRETWTSRVRFCVIQFSMLFLKRSRILNV